MQQPNYPKAKLLKKTARNHQHRHHEQYAPGETVGSKGIYDGMDNNRLNRGRCDDRRRTAIHGKTTEPGYTKRRLNSDTREEGRISDAQDDWPKLTNR